MRVQFVNITKERVEKLPIGGLLWDEDLHGFGVRRQRGKPVYFVKVRIDGRQRWLTIGPHGSPWTAASARKEAHRLIGSIHGGSDPATVRDRKRDEPTIGKVLDRYLSEYVAVHNKPSTAAEIKKHVERDLRPEFGAARIGAISRSEIVRWHAGYSDRPYYGNRALAYLRKALSLASKDWELRPDNPALGIRMFPEPKRERFFSEDELGRIGAALSELEAESELPGGIRAVRLLALTGMRLGEVLALEWAWLHPAQGCFLLPDDVAKAGARAVALGKPALTYLARLERNSPFICFGSDPRGPLGEAAFYRLWRHARDRAKLENARPHDFRHTVGTYSAQTGANAFQVRDILGHKTLAMTGRYVEKNIDPLRATADAVSRRVEDALSGKVARK